jgi:hypothetical protein
MNQNKILKAGVQTVDSTIVQPTHHAQNKPSRQAHAGLSSSGESMNSQTPEGFSIVSITIQFAHVKYMIPECCEWTEQEHERQKGSFSY